MDKDTTQSTFSKYLSLMPLKKISKLVRCQKLDRYIKKLKTLPFLYLMLLAQLSQAESLRKLSTEASNNDDLQKLLGIDSISAAQLSRRLRDLPTQFLQVLFDEINQRLARGNKRWINGEPRVNQLHIIDSSTITLCLSQYRWADYRSTKAGVKVHLRLVFSDRGVYPDKVIMKPAKHPDISQLDNLIVEETDALVVFDRGYVDFAKWDRYCDDGIRFVSRLKDGFITEILEERPVTGTSMVESIVLLGNPGTTQMKHPLRLIKTRDSQGNPVVIVTNDLNISAQEISDIYRHRWQIELFFKWIKQHLVIKKCYGKSEYTVYNQIWIALIAFCLLTLFQKDIAANKKLLEIQRLLLIYLFRPLEELLAQLKRVLKKSRGRRKDNNQQIFDLTVWQVENGEAEFIHRVDCEPIYL
ncbi:IS4 family transposase [Desulfofundulus thermobenzoicus]|uniref:IS4 family transposase n=1 Tax=Desulfofundulus thermobenzoicus TaxID=29376 RepID=A0A6N7IV80_9FIRM|nr:IS4 family transposase [Desulfofundulus thermobenzoicus]MQL54025.1 IS4 family transposase [Desulfofundulus thermobenzoicus]